MAPTSRSSEVGGDWQPSFDIRALSALEVLDSRGRPTVAVSITLGDGSVGAAGVPSGASTGTREAVELRDGDKTRFAGAGVLQAVGHVNGEIADLLQGRSWSSLAEVDAAMIDARRHAEQGPAGRQRHRRGLDGAGPRAGGLGREAVVRVAARVRRAGTGCRCRNFNVLNGGAHAPNALDFQEFMISPLGAPSLAEAVRAGAEVYAALKKRLAAAGHATGLGDEGGFAPDLATPEEVLQVIVEAITDAGYTPGRDGVGIALDPAASEFCQPDGALPGRRVDAVQRRHDRAVRGDGRRVPDLEHRGRPRRGRPRRLAAPDRAPRATGSSWSATTTSAPIRRSSPTPSPTASANAALIKLNQVGIGHRDPRGDGDLPPCRVRRDGVAPLRGEPRTPSSPTSPSAPAAGRSRPAPRPAVSGWRSTTGCWRSPRASPALPTVWSQPRLIGAGVHAARRRSSRRRRRRSSAPPDWRR